MMTAAEIIDELDGAAIVARKTGIAYTTVASWRAANFIPEWRRPAILKIAKGKIKPSDFPPSSARISRNSSQDAAA